MHMSEKADTENMTLAKPFADEERAEKKIPLENEILDHLANSTAIFKSQQKDDPELSHDEKITIAHELLCKSHGMFLAKFGKYLKKEHLSYFENKDKDYETTYHLNQLERYFNESKRQTDVKNRRYQALKVLVEKGEYFSETEMMKRNPLLYENLIGQYLTEDQKKKRDNIDTTNITFVNLLLESIERDRVRDLKKSQQDIEDEVTEENDSDDDSDNEERDRRKNNLSRIKSHWGEMSGGNATPSFEKKNEKYRPQASQSIPLKERQILREEFVTQMYESFLEGKDAEFDYSTVDDNEAYDNVDMRNYDEEEKYFDSESPETVLLENIKETNDSEDELDIYMRSLKVK